MNAALALLALVMQVSAPEPTATFPVTVDASAGGGLALLGASSPRASLTGELALAWYYRQPIVDDASPFGLQAYLQRRNAISLGVQAEGWNAKSELEDDHSRTLGARLGWLGYWRRYVFAAEAFYARVDERQTSAANGTVNEVRRQAHLVRPSFSFGIRDETLELRASYLWPAYAEGETLTVPTWRAFALAVRLVPDLTQSFSLLVYTLPNNGGGASATYEHFRGQGSSFWLRGHYESGQFYPPIQCDDSTRYGGDAGLRHWLSNRLEWRFWISASALRAVCKREDTADVDPAYGRDTALVQVLANVGVATRIPGRPVTTDRDASAPPSGPP